MESSPQFAIGIFGGWGSGKTTLMRAIEDKLDSSRAVSVQFSAWRYEKEEHLIVPLLDTIREALVAGVMSVARLRARRRRRLRQRSAG
jgi:predicted KAP-like P-loop ATPase